MPVELSSRPPEPQRQESIVEILWRRKQLVLLVFGLCVVSAAVWLKFTPKRLTAEGKVEVTRNLPKNADASIVDLPTFLNTQAIAIKSAPVLSLAMGAPGMDEIGMFAGVDNPVDYLRDRLDVQPLHQSSDLAIRLSGTNTDETIAVVDAVVKAYVAHVEDQKRNSALATYTQISQDRATLDEQRTGEKKYLASLQAELAPYLASGGDEAGNVTIAKLKTLSTTLTTAQLDTVNYKSQFDDALRAVNMTPDAIDQGRLADATVVSAESLQLLKNNLAAMNQQLIEAKRQFVPSHPVVRNVQKQIREMQLSQAATLQQLLASSAAKEKDTRELYAAQEKLVQGVNAKVVELNGIAEKVKVDDQRVAALDSKLQTLNLVESVGIEAKEVDDVVTDPTSAVPDPKKTLGLAALIGLALGMMTALVREWVSPSLGAVHRIADTVGIPLLGTLPRVTGFNTADLAKLTFAAADSTAAEAFRSVRTSLLFGADHCQTIAVTSPTTGDGKTTLASNLAILLAQSGKRVALIDADFRQPSLHDVFGVDNPVGLSGTLNGDELETAIRRTAIEHLDVIPSGPRSSETSQQLNSPRFAEVLRELKSRYDHVLFDTAGVIGSNDARVIAAGCDATVLVMRDERTTRFAATTARDALLSVGAALMGIVLNDAARTGPAYPPAVGRSGPATPAPGAGARLRVRR